MVVGSDAGGSEKVFIWDSEISKTTILVPLYNIAITCPPTKYLAIQYGYIALNNIPLPPIESINNLILINNNREQMSE